MLVISTIHDLQTGTSKLRRRPKHNQLNSKITRAVFGNEVRSLALLAGSTMQITLGAYAINHSGPH